MLCKILLEACSNKVWFERHDHCAKCCDLICIHQSTAVQYNHELPPCSMPMLRVSRTGEADHWSSVARRPWLPYISWRKQFREIDVPVRRLILRTGFTAIAGFTAIVDAQQLCQRRRQRPINLGGMKIKCQAVPGGSGGECLDPRDPVRPG